VKDYSQSILDRLKAIFKETKEPYDRLLLQYGMERFLYRLSSSKLKSQFILKGGILFFVWTEKKFRPTKDLDFCYSGNFEKDSLFLDIKKICQIELPEDGLQFNNFKMNAIKEDHEYDGIRITFDGWLKKVRIPMQLDISTGDKITPDATELLFPGILGMNETYIKSYPKETVFSEKAEAMVQLDTATSRMKDIYDLYIIIRMFTETLDKEILKAAITTTFTHRQTKIPKAPAKVFSDHFYNDFNKQKQWKAFIKKSTEPTLQLEEAIKVIADFINPLFDEIHG
jgi:hypothetical protein